MGIDGKRLPCPLVWHEGFTPDARCAKKHTTQWVGYKVHLTETCDEDLPRLVTHVETPPGPTADGDMVPVIHAALAERALLPDKHLVDTGFLDAALLVSSREDYQVELVGPTRSDYQWQARDGTGFAMEHFVIDWEHQQATYPEGNRSISWTHVDRGWATHSARIDDGNYHPFRGSTPQLIQ